MTDATQRSLAGVAVLVTRPAVQAAGLCAAITTLRGQAIEFPAIAIEPVEPALAPTGAADLVIFTSANAVAYGRQHIRYDAHTRFAVVGEATAVALRASGLPEPLVPSAEQSSEGLLADARLMLPAGARVCLVRGVGGRDVLPQALRERGLELVVLEVYRRTKPAHPLAHVQDLEARWAMGGIDVVTATSVETLENLHSILSTRGQALLAATPLIVVSPRIAMAARQLGHAAACEVAPGPGDDAIVRALLDWRHAVQRP